MKNLILIFILLGAKISFAQSIDFGAFNRNMVANWDGKYYQVGAYTVKGSPFLYAQSMPGEIKYKSGTTDKTKKVFYDIYNQKAGADVNNERFEAQDPVESFSVQIPLEYGGTLLQFKPASSFGKNSLKGFVAVLADGIKASFLQYYRATLLADPLNEMDKQSRVFDHSAEYYLYNKSSGELKKVKLREKDIIKEFGSDKSIEAFVKANNFDLSSEAGTIKFINSFQ